MQASLLSQRGNKYILVVYSPRILNKEVSQKSIKNYSMSRKTSMDCPSMSKTNLFVPGL